MHLAAVGILFLAGRGAPGGEPGDEPPSLLPLVERLGTEIQWHAAVQLLDLDEGQRSALSAIARLLEEERAGYVSRSLTLLEGQESAFRAFREADLDGGEFGADVERAAGRAEHDAKELHLEATRNVEAHAARCREILTPGQLLVLDALGPEDLPRTLLAPRNEMPADPLERTACSALRDMAGARGDGTRTRAERGAQAIMEAWADAGREAWDEAAEERRIAQALESAATLPQPARERALPALVRAVLPRDPVRHAEEELQRIHAQEYGKFSTLGRLLLADCAVAALQGECTAARAAVDPTLARRQSLEASVRELREDINRLNLLNGLHLTRAQLQELARLGNSAPAAPPPPLDGAALVDGLRRACAAAAAGHGPDPRTLRTLERELPRLEQRRAGIGPGPRPDGAPALGVLTAAQQHVLADYQPCLIPPRDLKDPVRVGQAGSDERGLEILRRVRQIPAPRYAGQRDAAAERTLSEIEKHQGAFPPEERARRLAELQSLFDEVRAMDDVTFALRAAELSSRMESFAYAEQLKAVARGAGGEERLERKASQFLADARFAGLASEVLARREARGLPDPVDLATIHPAEACRDGRCAVD